MAKVDFRVSNYAAYVGGLDRCSSLRLALFLTICREGMRVESAYRLLCFPKNLLLQNARALCDLGVMECGFDTLDSGEHYDEIITLTPAPNCRIIGLVLSKLIAAMSNRQASAEVVVATRLFLNYLMERQGLWSTQTKTAESFCRLVILFAPRYEESLVHCQRRRVYRIEDRLDYRLLELVAHHLSSPCKGAAFCLMGNLFADGFRYNDADRCFKQSQLLDGETASLLLARSRMLENLGHTALACQETYQAYEISLEQKNYPQTTDACLRLAHLCSLALDMQASERWLQNATKYSPMTHAQRVKMYEIRGMLQCSHNTNEALNWLDMAETASIRLYGQECPELGNIWLARCNVLSYEGRIRESDLEYLSYINAFAFNYGRSVGALVAMHSCMINQHLHFEDTKRAKEAYRKLCELEAESDERIAPGVQLGMQAAKCGLMISLGDHAAAAKCIKEGLDLCDELAADEETMPDLSQVFLTHNLPEKLCMTGARKLFLDYKSRLCVANKRYAEAINIIDEIISIETTEDAQEMWSVYKGYIIACQGDVHLAMHLWQKAVEHVSIPNKCNVMVSVARYAREFGYPYYALSLLDDVFSMDYDKFADDADAAIAEKMRRELQEECD